MSNWKFQNFRKYYRIILCIIAPLLFLAFFLWLIFDRFQVDPKRQFGDSTLHGDAIISQGVIENADASKVHPMFDIDSLQLIELVHAVLNELTDHIPQPDSSAIVELISKNPRGFLEYLELILQEPDQILLALVDKNNSLPAEYIPRGLQNLEKYSSLLLNREGLSLRAEIMPDLLKMVAEAESQGVTLPITSSYRSYAYQERLFQWHIDTYGIEEAERVSAAAGRSQHQLGTTVDFGILSSEYAETEGGRWLADNAWKFGFSLSYPKGYEEVTGYSFEPWHYRYLGKATVLMQREFFLNIQQYALLFYDRAEERFREYYLKNSR